MTIDKQFIGDVKNNSLEEVFKCIYKIDSIHINKVNIKECSRLNDATLFIELK